MIRIAQAEVARLPAPIQQALAQVTLHVLEAAPRSWDETARACFVGWPGVTQEDIDENDEGQEEDPPVGKIFMVASRYASADEVRFDLLHEIGHAVGFDETDLALMGLNLRGVQDADGDPGIDPDEVAA